jgi:hypothetical protein
MDQMCRELSGAVHIHTGATKRLGGTVPAVGTPLAGATVTGILFTALLLARHPTNTVETPMIHDHSLWWELSTYSHFTAVTLRFMNTQHLDLTILGNITDSL